MSDIRIRSARTHNLKGIDLSLPRDRLIVITGLSGSGKSSLAFDTIYAEGQRRYVESLSAYARQFLSVMSKPDVGPYRGAVAGHRHRAALGLAQPALHRGDGNRDLRLHAPAIRPRRSTPLPDSPARACRADHQRNGRRSAQAPRGHGHQPDGAGGAQPQGRTPQAVRRPGGPGIRSRACRRCGVRNGGPAGTGPQAQPHHRSGGGPPAGARRIAPAAGRILRNRADPDRRNRPGGFHRRLRAHRRAFLQPLCLPDVRLRHT